MSKRILLIYSNYSSFVKSDYEILSEKFEVDRYQFKAIKSLFPFLFQFIKQFTFLIVKGWRYDAFFIWFADYHSFLPTLFGRLSKKKSVIVVGGFDAVSIPSIEFGVFYKNNLRTKLVKLSYRMAQFILPVDETLIKSTNYYVDPDGQKIGILNYIDKIHTIIKTVPTGYHPELWKRERGSIKRDVITVGGCSDMKTFRRKGHDFFLNVARQMPDYKFTLVGIAEPIQKKIMDSVPANVKIMGFVDQQEMVQLFSTHKIFTQFSLSEGLPNTLCEAMLCGCIPIGSNVNGIPKAIGDTGFVLYKRNVGKATELVKVAAQRENCSAARERIIKLFDMNKRINTLVELLNYAPEEENH